MVSLDWNLKKMLSYVKPAPRICLVAKFGAKINILKFETKLSDLGFFELKLKKKTIVIFEISNLEFVKNESLTHTANFGIGSTFS